MHHPGLHHVPSLFCTYYAVVYLQGGRGPSRIERDRMKLALLEEAHIVCSTLSFSGSGLFAQMSRKFDVVVIDEAAQAVEPAILVPLVQGVKQVSQSSAPMLHQVIHTMCRAKIRSSAGSALPTVSRLQSAILDVTNTPGPVVRQSPTPQVM